MVLIHQTFLSLCQLLSQYFLTLCTHRVLSCGLSFTFLPYYYMKLVTINRSDDDDDDNDDDDIDTFNLFKSQTVIAVENHQVGTLN